MALFTSIGVALGASMATLATVGGVGITSAFAAGLGASAIAGAGAWALTRDGKKSGSQRAGVNMPKSPTMTAAAERANTVAAERKKASARTKSVRTSPLGIAGEAEVAKKTLLGQ